MKTINKEISNTLEKINSIYEKAKNNNITLEHVNIELTDPIESYQMVINRRNELELVKNTAKELEKTLTKLLKEKNVIALDKYLSEVLTINNYRILITSEEKLELDVAKDFS